MATSSTGAISSTGIGSGLDVKSIVSALVAIEKQPLTALQKTATKYQTQLSLYGTIKSQTSTLYDAAALLSGSSGWNSQTASSSNATAVSVTTGSSAMPTSMSVDVSQLARAQTAASVGVAAGAAVGASGSLNIDLGSWSSDSVPVFTKGSTVTVGGIVATDTISSIASKINAANAGVTASVLNDGANQRLVIRSSTSGVAAGFRLNTPADAGLSSLGLTNPDSTGFVGQTALNAKVKINGVAVESATNTMTNVAQGVTLQLNQANAGPVEISVANDLDVVQKNIQSFVDAYNALNTTLSDATKYDSSTKTGGVLQGDSTTVGLENALGTLLGSSSTGSTYSHLSDVGLERQKDGSLKINQTKLTAAEQDLPNLKLLFTASSSDPSTSGFGVKVRDFSHSLINFDGRVTNKATALQGSIDRNSKDQDQVNAHAATVEAMLNTQYTALDKQMAKLTSLGNYMTSQVAQWNKSTS